MEDKNPMTSKRYSVQKTLRELISLELILTQPLPPDAQKKAFLLTEILPEARNL